MVMYLSTPEQKTKIYKYVTVNIFKIIMYHIGIKVLIFNKGGSYLFCRGAVGVFYKDSFELLILIKIIYSQFYCFKNSYLIQIYKKRCAFEKLFLFIR